MTRLRGRTALVSGGAQGLGRAIARRLAAEGASISVVDLNADRGEECADLIRADGGVASFTRANIARDEDIQSAVTSTLDLTGSLHILVNAAQYFAMPKALEVTSMRDWELSESTGPRASFRFMQLAFPHLRTAGNGAVINFTSGSAIAGIRYTAPYSAAKGAVLALTKVAANEWAQHGIRVNALCPFALTETQEKMIGTEWDNYSRTAAASPFGRGADPDGEIAPAVAFLASDDASFVTGTVLHVDGGMTQLSTVDYSGTPELHEPAG